MTRTVVESKTKTAIIGFDQPFCVIGERINPTGRKKLAAELEAGDFIEMVQDLVDIPLCIDSSVPGALEAGLEACQGRPLLNSVTGEEERLELVLPLVKKYNVPVVAISNDDTGISENPDVRFEVAKKIVHRAADFGIPAHDIVVDPLVMPIGAMATAGLQVFALVRRLREELGVNTTCGASNVSFGLPNRHAINAAFLPMAIAAGMTSAIMNPVRPQEMEAIRAANLLMNNDPHGARWIKHNKPPVAEGAVEEGARGRREGRRRRAVV
jgi:5-methyltetrahydrofolate--homocysteine methyltransferase